MKNVTCAECEKVLPYDKAKHLPICEDSDGDIAGYQLVCVDCYYAIQEQRELERRDTNPEEMS